MDTHLERIFLTEIEYQRRFVIQSYNDLIQAISMRPSGTISFRIWTAIQSILISCANISKILNPQTSMDKSLKIAVEEHGNYLKRKLSVDDTSSLLSRDLRNHFEHFDERLHSWAKESHVFIHRNIGPQGSIRIDSNSNISPESNMANFDQYALRLTFWQNEFDINRIIEDVQMLLKNTQAELSKLSGFSF